MTENYYDNLPPISEFIEKYKLKSFLANDSHFDENRYLFVLFLPRIFSCFKLNAQYLTAYHIFHHRKKIVTFLSTQMKSLLLTIFGQACLCPR